MTTRKTMLRRAAITTAVSASLAAWSPVANTANSKLHSSAIDVAGLSSTMKPCADFYTYSNEKWLGATRIPDDRSSWGASQEINKHNEEVLKTVLKEATAKSLPRDSAGRKVADYYASGMDTARIEKAGLTPLQPELDRIAKMATQEDLVSELAHLQRLGVGAGFDFGVEQDAKNSSRYWLSLSQGGLGLPDRDYYFKDDEKTKTWRAEYVKHVARMFELMGEKPAAAKSAAETVMRLETRLAGASMTKVELRDPNAIYNKRTVAELAGAAPEVDWSRYFKGIGVTEVQDFNVGQPKFLKELASATKDVPVDDWKVYLRWHLVHSAAPRLSSRFEQENFQFYGATLSGKKTQLPRDKRVLDTINGSYGEQPLSMALGELYVAKAFRPEAKAKAVELVDNVKAVLKERIGQLDWMSDTTKAKALQKLASMNVKIGYPDERRDYATLKIGRVPYVENWLAANQFATERDLKKLGKPVDRKDWIMSPQTVNAYYNPTMNEIVFPAGILQPPRLLVSVRRYGSTGRERARQHLVARQPIGSLVRSMDACRNG
jgi:putative endopeptidase